MSHTWAKAGQMADSVATAGGEEARLDSCMPVIVAMLVSPLIDIELIEDTWPGADAVPIINSVVHAKPSATTSAAPSKRRTHRAPITATDMITTRRVAEQSQPGRGQACGASASRQCPR